MQPGVMTAPPSPRRGRSDADAADGGQDEVHGEVQRTESRHWHALRRTPTRYWVKALKRQRPSNQALRREAELNGEDCLGHGFSSWGTWPRAALASRPAPPRPASYAHPYTWW